MDKTIITIVVLFGATVYYLPNTTPTPKVEVRQKIDMSGSQGDFIKKYVNVAITETKAFKIPTSVILATAVTSSECYDSPQHHNMFRLPPDTNWEGEVITFADADGGEYTLKKYNTVWESFRDFSITVTNITIAQEIKIEGLTVDGWLYILQENGICNAVAAKSIIDRYRLTVLDDALLKH